MNEDIRKILDENIIATLGTVNEDGSPWNTPVHFVASDNLVYWFSSENTQHSKNIERDNRVSLTVYSEDKSQGPKAIYFNGRADIAPGDYREGAKKWMTEKLGSFPPHFEKATAYGLPIGELNSEKTVANCWYFHS